MPTFSGNTSTSATSTAYDIPSKILSFSIANKTGGAVTASVGVLYGSTFYFIYNKSIATAESYIYSGEEIIVPANYQIYVAVSGDCDYYFSLV